MSLRHTALGNILFVIFINYIAKLNIDGKMTMYADYTTITVKAENYDILQSRVTSIMLL